MYGDTIADTRRLELHPGIYNFNQEFKFQSGSYDWPSLGRRINIVEQASQSGCDWPRIG